MNNSKDKNVVILRHSKESVFELSLWTYDKQRRRHKDDYQRFTLSKGHTAYFETVKDAEKAIPSWIEDAEECLGLRNIYCFKIIEKPHVIQITSRHENLSERIYDQYGQKLDERLYPTVGLTSDGESDYHGRPDDQIRYKPGDVVEFAEDLFVIECFMTPLSKKRWTSVDETDDGYIALRVDEDADEIRYDKDGYVILDDQNPQCTDIFPPHFPFSPKVQKRIDNLRQFVMNIQDSD